MTPPAAVVSLDPGVRKVGVALWVDRTLVLARTIVAADPAHEVAALADATLGLEWGLVVERMAHYPGRHGRARDLDRVHRMAKAVALAARARTSWVRWVTPATWKGQVPKAVIAGRVRRALLVAEIDRVPWDEHDAVDAVGIGLVGLDRVDVAVRERGL